MAQAPIIIAGHVETEKDFDCLKELHRNLCTMFKEQVDNMEEHLEKEHYGEYVRVLQFCIYWIYSVYWMHINQHIDHQVIVIN